MQTYSYVCVSSTDQNEDRQTFAMSGLNIPPAPTALPPDKDDDFDDPSDRDDSA